MSKSIEFLVENQDEIMQSYDNSNASPKKTWNSLKTTLPQLCATMTFSTFKQYLSVLIALSAKLQTESNDELSKIGYENAELVKELSELKQELSERDKEIEGERSKISNLSQNIHQMGTDLTKLQSKMKMLETELSTPVQSSRNINGWTVRLTTKGYYHLCKSFGGKVKSIYIGKVLDYEKAKQKIAEHMSKIR